MELTSSIQLSPSSVFAAWSSRHSPCKVVKMAIISGFNECATSSDADKVVCVLEALCESVCACRISSDASAVWTECQLLSACVHLRTKDVPLKATKSGSEIPVL